MELSVSEDLVVGTVPLDLLESFDESLDDLSVLKLAFERRRRSLKNGIWLTKILGYDEDDQAKAELGAMINKGVIVVETKPTTKVQR